MQERAAGAVLDRTTTPQPAWPALSRYGHGTQGTSTPPFAVLSDYPFVEHEFRVEHGPAQEEPSKQAALAILLVLELVLVIAWLSSRRQVASELPRRPDSILQSTLNRLSRLAKLSKDWDSYGGDPPTKRSVSTAYGLLFEVDERFGPAAGQRISPFAIVPLAYGGVQMEWRGPFAEVEIEIGPEGKFGYLFIDKRGPERVFHEKDSATRSEILDLIAQTLISRHA